MTTITFRDVEQLSASLDGQLSQAEKTRLEARIQLAPALSATLLDLQQARAILRRTPTRRLPRNFTLTPKMAGIKPPIPRLVPVFSWASVAAMLLFVLTLGANLLGRLSFGAAAPLMAVAPLTNESYGVAGGPPATQAPASDNTQVIPTAETLINTAPEATPPGEARLTPTAGPPATKAAAEPVKIWSYILLGLAVLFIAVALLLSRASVLAFRRRVGGKDNK